MVTLFTKGHLLQLWERLIQMKPDNRPMKWHKLLESIGTPDLSSKVRKWVHEGFTNSSRYLHFL